MLVISIVGACKAFDTILFQVLRAVFTCPARINEASNGCHVTSFKFDDVTTRLCDPADYFVTGYRRVDGSTPVISGGMQIRVAYTTEENFYFNIVRSQISALDVH